MPAYYAAAAEKAQAVQSPQEQQHDRHCLDCCPFPVDFCPDKLAYYVARLSTIIGILIILTVVATISRALPPLNYLRVVQPSSWYSGVIVLILAFVAMAASWIFNKLSGLLLSLQFLDKRVEGTNYTYADIVRSQFIEQVSSVEFILAGLALIVFAIAYAALYTPSTILGPL